MPEPRWVTQRNIEKRLSQGYSHAKDSDQKRITRFEAAKKQYFMNPPKLAVNRKI